MTLREIVMALGPLNKTSNQPENLNEFDMLQFLLSC